MIAGSIRRVAVAMSGGIDSAVTAALLQKQGYAVHGVFMRNWDEWNTGELRSGDCQAERDWRDVQRISRILKIDCHQVDFVKEYWTQVFTDVVDGYRRGLTPNPDERCNRQIKFGALQQHLMTQTNLLFQSGESPLSGEADWLATGHYARLYRHDGDINNNNPPQLMCAVDHTKDQSFFLCTVPRERFARVLFPLGEFRKRQVRGMARQFGLQFLLDKPESTGICFVGEKGRQFQRFLGDYISETPTAGWIVDLNGLTAMDDGDVLTFLRDCRQLTPSQLREKYGKQALLSLHDGMHRWTIGQRLRMPGLRDRYRVAYKHAPTRTVFVVAGSCTGKSHRGEDEDEALLSRRCRVELLGGDDDANSNNLPLNARAMCRYHSLMEDCRIYRTDNNSIEVEFSKKIYAQCPGQTIAFYDNQDRCLFGGRVLSVRQEDKRLQQLYDQDVPGSKSVYKVL
jgi:tRNA-specific 2-thiouridylase